MTDSGAAAEPGATEAGAMAVIANRPPGSKAVPAIELVGVAKEFHSRDGNVQAVESVDLAIRQGEFFSLLGPSGCGKTTTLRMIAGFEEPTRGEILLYGEDVTDVSPNHRDVNLVFQSYALFPHMSVLDNVAFGLRRRNVPKREIATRVGEMLELVELAGRQRRRPSELSGGQQQRVALARALVNRPRALLLDEPLGALDLKLRQAMQIELKRIQREIGITFVYVTHDQGEALTMSDRLVVMNEGRVEQLGGVREIYERPRTRFVAGFIGTSNLLTGRVQRISEGIASLDAGADERLLVPVTESMSVGNTVELTVRPEKIALRSQRPADACALRGTVAEIVYLGTSTNYTVSTGRGASVVVFAQNAASPESVAERGDEVWLCWAPEHSYAIPGADPGPRST
ncbi:MAG TPA: ABC transporter ATP-binding protein [Solirubrobacteraceae bacterium]|nr:ABC transporter ATP-binding protein [Solirubrobacteraceae bacterium]